MTCLLSAIAVLACAEGFSLRAAAPEPIIRIILMAAGGWVGVWSLVRHLAMLSMPGHAAEQSVCRQCSTYGILEVASARCRKCGYEWIIE